jgi:MFS family permease
LTAIALEDGSAETAPLPLRQVAAVGVGNALAFYDFLTFSFFSIQIGQTFFPSGDASHSLLWSLATFGVGFATRPVGGFVIGLYADRAGRKPAMILAFALMGLGIVGVALTPSYAAIGAAAPILLVLFRLIQGFALGGEVGPSTAFLVEAAPPERRGLYLALQFGTQDVAVLVAGIVGFALANWLTPLDLQRWGWRAAFLVGAAIVPLGLAMRRSLPETHAPPDRASRRVRPPLRLVLVGLGMIGAAMISAYVLDYTTTYAQDVLKLAAGPALFATVVIGAVSVVCDLSSGLLTDRVGRRPVMLTGVGLFILLAVPAYWAMNAWPTPGVVYGVAALIAALVAFAANPALIALTEAMPKAVRSTAVGAIYAVAVASLGGTTQFMIKWLSGVTHSPIAPAWYLTAALIMGATAMAFMPETAPVKIGVLEEKGGPEAG